MHASTAMIHAMDFCTGAAVSACAFSYDIWFSSCMRRQGLKIMIICMPASRRVDREGHGERGCEVSRAIF